MRLGLDGEALPQTLDGAGGSEEMPSQRLGTRQTGHQEDQEAGWLTDKTHEAGS